LAGCRQHAVPRSEDTNWEGGWRVPAFLRWPGKIKPGTILTGIGSHIDMFPTLLAAQAIRTSRRSCSMAIRSAARPTRSISTANNDSLRDGAAKESPRNAVIYFSDDGEVMAVRVGDYKFNLAVQRATRMMQWAGTFGES